MVSLTQTQKVGKMEIWFRGPSDVCWWISTAKMVGPQKEYDGDGPRNESMLETNEEEIFLKKYAIINNGFEK